MSDSAFQKLYILQTFRYFHVFAAKAAKYGPLQSFLGGGGGGGGGVYSGEEESCAPFILTRTASQCEVLF